MRENIIVLSSADSKGNEAFFGLGLLPMIPAAGAAWAGGTGSSLAQLLKPPTTVLVSAPVFETI